MPKHSVALPSHGFPPAEGGGPEIAETDRRAEFRRVETDRGGSAGAANGRWNRISSEERTERQFAVFPGLGLDERPKGSRTAKAAGGGRLSDHVSSPRHIDW